MTPIVTIWVFIACIYVPLAAVLLAALTWLWRTKRTAGNAPVREGLLRAPGESLRLKADELSDRLGTTFAAAIMMPGFVMAMILVSSPGGTLTTGRAWAALAACTVLLLPMTWLLFRRADELRNYRLGFHGERAAGEQINQLMREGCYVFHDVPLEPYGNVDHVVISPAGVFAVETKAHRKRKAPKGRREWEVTYDGKVLDFPTYVNKSNLDDARRGANLLRAMLSKAVGEEVRVSPVLALPGWNVLNRVKDSDVAVLNPKNIRFTVLPERGAGLSRQLAERIAYQLEQKCRDVEL